MGVNLSLRSKGIVAILVLLGYLGAIAAFLSQERKALFAIVQQVDSNRFAARLIEPATTGLTLALVENQSVLGTMGLPGAQPASARETSDYLEALNVALEQVRAVFPAIDPDVERFRRAISSSMIRASAAHLSNVRDSGQALLVKLQAVQRELQREETELSMRYDEKQHFISAFAVSANIVGAVASVAVILVFFSRLANDLKALRERASAVVSGYDGTPLPVSRRDEVGDLQVAVNRMQEDLRKSERQVEVARQQRFHQEKMAAVGSLASAIGHEVSNPMAAISGVAQFIADESASDERPQGRQINQFAREILHQTERVSHIMRQLSTLTAPRSPDPELLDLNALVRSTCGFIRFDKRFRRIELEPFLDPDLPAVMGVADHLTQVLMNLLINAADAMDGLESERCHIRVATRRADGAVELTVTDSGRGMTQEVLAKAFDESFTTKPAGRGRGIGLFICKSLVEKAGGRIELASVPGQGTTATLRLPLRTSPGD